MPLSIRGYVLEKPRVGAANSPFTATPDNIISDPVAFLSAYPDATGMDAAESKPRTEYLVYVEGDTLPSEPPYGNLATARFGWTKNEGVVVGGVQIAFPRFDYDGAAQRFKPLPGGVNPAAQGGSSPRLANQVGVLSQTANTQRIKVTKPVVPMDLSSFPIRVAVGMGPTGSGVTFPVTLVDLDTDLTTEPAPGEVRLSLQSGALGWNTGDLIAYDGQAVRFQRQSFFTYRDSNGRIGAVGDDVLLLNPVPASGQHPILRFGATSPLVGVEVSTESDFTTQSAGHFQWAADTGRLNLSPDDVTSLSGTGVYYDGVLCGTGLSLPTESLGIMPAALDATPLSIPTLPPNGGDLVFSVGGVQIPYVSRLDSGSSLDPIGQASVAQVQSTGPTSGQVLFSLSDRAAYAGQQTTLVTGDLPIEHGLSLRFFRNPVNLTGQDGTLKDVTCTYDVTGALLSSPIVAQPQVFLPQVPQGTPSRVYVEQGTGSFVGDLARLDTPSPPEGYGYVLDIDQKTLQYAQRKQNVTVQLVRDSGVIQLPDPLLVESNLVVSLETGVGTNSYTPLVLGQDAVLEPLSGLVSFVATQGTPVTRTSGSMVSGTLVSSEPGSLSSVRPGDIVLVPTSDAAGLYTVRSVDGTGTTATLDVTGPDGGPFECEVKRGREILADRFFEEVILADPATKVEHIRGLGVAANTPRLAIPRDTVTRVRFRFGLTSYGTGVTVVSADADFSDPAILPVGTVEVSQTTGNLNFSVSDLGQDIYQVIRLRQQLDYRLTAGLGLVTYTDRALTDDEGLITYVPVDETNGTTLPQTTEAATFLVRKEVTQDHPSPTTKLQFNPAGKRVASTPLPAVFRGGRPQQLGVQCLVDTGSSTITFLGDSQVTDALPHGAIISPEERVYIDYYILQALGGENTTSVSLPMSVTQLTITAGETSFSLMGDWTDAFPAGHLLRVEGEEVYLLGGASYDPVGQVTTVRLAPPQTFNSDYNAPRVYVSSGPTPYTTTLFQPSYFVSEQAVYNPVSRGSNQIVLQGDRTAFYRAGTIVVTSDTTASFLRFYPVSGAAYNPSTGATTVTLSGATSTQVKQGVQTLRHSVRPVLETATDTFTTSLSPVLTQGYTVYRRMIGSPGVILPDQPNAAYTLDDSGRLVLSSQIQRGEEIGILYTGHTIVPAGRRVKADYTAVISPDQTNGLLNQVLRMDYTVLSPDSFFWRVETYSNFRSELAQQYKDAASSTAPSGGPVTSNASQPKLYEQGRKSLFFDEGRYANEDTVARPTLKFYNDGINYLEDVLEDMDGRVVGDLDGRFRFDGVLGRVVEPSASLNQIDDLIKVSPFPCKVNLNLGSFPPFSLDFSDQPPYGTFQAAYLPSNTSRIFPMAGHFFGVPSLGLNTGDPVLQVGRKSLTAIGNIHTRPAWAVVTQDAKAGDTTLQVDNPQGAKEMLRPGFLKHPSSPASPSYRDVTGTLVSIQTKDGSSLLTAPAANPAFTAGTFPPDPSIPPLDPATVWEVMDLTANSLTLSRALPQDVPAGATIFQADFDYQVANGFVGGRDFSLDPDGGNLIYIAPFPPLDGSFYPFIPHELEVRPLPHGYPMNGRITFNNTSASPYKLPALYGKSTDDSGDISLPIQNPTEDCELSILSVNPSIVYGGTAQKELDLIGTVPEGTLRAATTPPYVSTTGEMNSSTVLHDPSGFGGVAPKPFDLVRITAGPNGPSTFRRVAPGGYNAGAKTITVDTAFLIGDAGPFPYAVSYEVGVSDSIVPSGSVSTSVTLNHVNDAARDFNALGVKVGHTVVVETGVNQGQRRQVIEVETSQRLRVFPAFSAVSPGASYRVDDSLATFGTPSGSGSLLDTEVSLLDQQPGILTTNVGTILPHAPWAETLAIENFLNLVFTDIPPGASPSTPFSTQGSTEGGAAMLTDTSVDFTSLNLTPGVMVYIRGNGLTGAYLVDTTQVTTHTLTVDRPFGSTEAGVSYRLVTSFGASFPSCRDLCITLAEIDTYAGETPAFKALLTMDVGMTSTPADTGAFTRATLASDLDARVAVITGRVSKLTSTDPTVNPIKRIENILAATDRLYDKRMTWIDARTNLETGILTKQSRAVSDRVKAQTDLVAQLTKLLAVQAMG